MLQSVMENIIGFGLVILMASFCLGTLSSKTKMLIDSSPVCFKITQIGCLIGSITVAIGIVIKIFQIWL